MDWGKNTRVIFEKNSKLFFCFLEFVQLSEAHVDQLLGVFLDQIFRVLAHRLAHRTQLLGVQNSKIAPFFGLHLVSIRAVKIAWLILNGPNSKMLLDSRSVCLYSLPFIS
jgi:hypothetical protein